METAILEILKGVPVAAVLFWMLVQVRKDGEKLQGRNEVLVDKLLEVTTVVASNTSVMERVERKLDEAKP